MSLCWFPDEPYPSVYLIARLSGKSWIKKSRAKCRSFIADPTRHFVSATTCSTVGDFPNLPLLSHSVAQNNDSIESMQEKSASTSRPRPRYALYPKICARCAGPCDPQLRSRPSHADVSPSPSENTDDCCEIKFGRSRQWTRNGAATHLEKN